MAPKKQCCAICRHDPGCMKKGLMVFPRFIQTGQDRELRRGPNGNLQEGFCCSVWEEKPQ